MGKLNGNITVSLPKLQLSSNPDIFVKTVKYTSRHSRINDRNSSFRAVQSTMLQGMYLYTMTVQEQSLL